MRSRSGAQGFSSSIYIYIDSLTSKLTNLLLPNYLTHALSSNGQCMVKFSANSSFLVVSEFNVIYHVTLYVI